MRDCDAFIPTVDRNCVATGVPARIFGLHGMVGSASILVYWDCVVMSSRASLATGGYTLFPSHGGTMGS